jgi:hypothetical protein
MFGAFLVLNVSGFLAILFGTFIKYFRVTYTDIVIQKVNKFSLLSKNQFFFVLSPFSLERSSGGGRAQWRSNKNMFRHADLWNLNSFCKHACTCLAPFFPPFFPRMNWEGRGWAKKRVSVCWGELWLPHGTKGGKLPSPPPSPLPPVLRLRPVLFSPGDYICRKGECTRSKCIAVAFWLLEFRYKLFLWLLRSRGNKCLYL